MEICKERICFLKIGIILFSLSLFNRTVLSESVDMGSVRCPKNYKCLQTFYSPGSFLSVRKLDLSFLGTPHPEAFDPITLLADRNGKLKEVKIAENVYYYQALWKGNEILVSRFDLDIGKSLRTLNVGTVLLLNDPNPNAKVLTTIPMNIVLDVEENTNPLMKRLGYVKVTHHDKVGWVRRDLLSDDEFDIQFYQLNLINLVKAHTFTAKEDNFKTELTITGEGFIVSTCKVGELDCSATYRMGESSFGMPEEAVYFDLTVSDGKQYVCEMRRVDFVGELQRVIDGYITEDELDPFINCSLSESETIEEETAEESSDEKE
ncbi:hypothetical protein EHQ79_13330 [Leptospira jelokensis]|nr:hypothetical protein EHQ79_13330 [Leptospira jelokensis]